SGLIFLNLEPTSASCRGASRSQPAISDSINATLRRDPSSLSLAASVALEAMPTVAAESTAIVCTISGALLGSIGTVTAPTDWIAQSQHIHSTRFSDATSTQPPGFSPASLKPDATASS